MSTLTSSPLNAAHASSDSHGSSTERQSVQTREGQTHRMRWDAFNRGCLLLSAEEPRSGHAAMFSSRPLAVTVLCVNRPAMAISTSSRWEGFLEVSGKPAQCNPYDLKTGSGFRYRSLVGTACS
jgi:hypothetical protein